MTEYEIVGDGKVTVGSGCSMGRNVQFIVSSGSSIELGDNITIGDGVKFVVEKGKVSVNDWTTLHSNTLVICKEGVEIGQHCWFGQNTVLDGTGGLVIKNGVRVGMYSQIWSHVAAGEQIEGCTLIGENPVFIDDDAWLVGSVTVGSGVTIGKKAICMNGSNITKKVNDNAVVMGVPAKPRDGLSFYKPISLDEKFALMEGWLVEFIAEQETLSLDKTATILKVFDNFQSVLIYKTKVGYDNHSIQGKESIFCIESKLYTKTQIDLERKLMKFLAGNKARFYSK